MPTAKRDPRGAKAKDPSGKTQLQLAKEAGVSLETWRGWQELKKMGGEELANRKKEAEIRRIETETEKAQRMLGVLDGEFYPRKEVEQSIAHLAIVGNDYDAAIISELPALLAGMKEADIEREVLKFVDDWKGKRADAESSVHEKARAAIQRELKGDLKKVAASQNGRKRDS